MQSMDRDKGQDISIALLIRFKKRRNVLIDSFFWGGVHNNDDNSKKSLNSSQLTCNN